MYLALSALADVFMYVLLPAWLLAALAVGRVAVRRTARGMRVTARAAAVLIVLAELTLIGRLATVGSLGSYGWVFAADRRLFTTVLVLVPAAVALASARRLADVARRTRRYAGPPLPGELRAAAAAPMVVLPVQVAVVGSVAVFFERYFPPDRPLLLNLLVYGAVAALVAVLLGRRVRWRAERVTRTDGRPRATGRVWAVRLGATVAAFGLVFGMVTYGGAASRLPDTYSMMQGTPDLGGGPSVAHAAHAGSRAGGADPVSVTDLVERSDGKPDRRFTLTAREAKVRLSSGATVSAWTFNGQIPGPELRMREGELVEITVLNRLPDQPISTHWHGVDVPNAEDGVPAVTQDAVQPGGRHTYRFRVEESGTRWYHSHQAGSVQVRRGLFGPLVIEPARPGPAGRGVDEDIDVMLHDWDTDGDTGTDGDLRPSMGTSDTLDRRPMEPGTRVGLRLVNTDLDTKTVTLTGTPHRVTALDGTEVNAPGEIRGRRLEIGTASRYDLEFTMPSHPVRLTDLDAPKAGILFSPDGAGNLAPKLDGPVFDPTGYGEPRRTPFGAGDDFDREFQDLLDEQFGFYDGEFVARMTVNGEVFPKAPMHMVADGDLVKMRFVNRGDNDHPMHIHGHHFLVLSRDGRAPTGSPLWLDTVNVRPGETWEIGFRADNPGIWMDHCHNFEHALHGMVLHLAYENVTTPFVVGGDAHNEPS
ncbi:MAG: multicopper oxidase domain-containing protein [Streptosporangiales bacterium]|nr:multicopper oxidase domain-containing protein [Streptosporangiales bacterium]